MQYLLLLLGFVLLIFSGRLLISCSISIARRLNLSPFVIGLTIVAIGTSAPELLVSMTGALKGHTDLAIYNIVGSNISNVLLVLALAAIILPIPVRAQSLKFDGSVLVFFSLIFWFFIRDMHLSAYQTGLLVDDAATAADGRQAFRRASHSSARAGWLFAISANSVRICRPVSSFCCGVSAANGACSGQRGRSRTPKRPTAASDSASASSTNGRVSSFSASTKANRAFSNSCANSPACARASAARMRLANSIDATAETAKSTAATAVTLPRVAR